MFALLLVLLAGTSQPQTPDPATQSGSARATYESIKRFIVASSEKMPAAEFEFQPTPEVRSFGQVLAHIIDANYLLCSPAVGEANPNGSVLDKTEKESWRVNRLSSGSRPHSRTAIKRTLVSPS